MKLHRPPVPGTLRLTAVATLVTAGALALRHGGHNDRWIAIGAGVLAVLLLIWWHGVFVTTTAGRWAGMLGRRLRRGSASEPGADARTTVVLELTPAADADVPLDLIAGYLDRYGVRCASIRLISVGTDQERHTWVALTVDAAANLAALQARSERIPLHETATTVARRLADHLRELGWTAQITGSPEVPTAPKAKETWRAMSDDDGYVTAYRVPVDHELADALTQVWACAAAEKWTVAELTGDPADPSLVVACALRYPDSPPARPPLGALITCNGRQRAVTDIANPLSTNPSREDGTLVTAEYLAGLRWSSAPQTTLVSA